MTFMRKLFVTLLLVIVLTMGVNIFQEGTSRQNVAHAATPRSTIIWPVDVAGHDWYILQGYNHNDHGSIYSQTDGLDLQLRSGSNQTEGQFVRSPVTGEIAGTDKAFDTDSGDCLFINYTDLEGNARTVSLCHLNIDSRWYKNGQVSQGIDVGKQVTQQQDQLGTIHYDHSSTNNNHLHFNIRDRNSNPNPIEFKYPDGILGCGNSEFKNDKISNEYYGYSVSCFGYWMGPTPTDSSQIHLYGSGSGSRTIQLGYHSNGLTVQHVDFWDYQQGKWNWIGSQNPNGNQQEFTSFTLYGPAYLGVDVLTSDGQWHEAQDSVRALCVISPNGSQSQCPSPVAYHDGSTQPIGVGGGGGIPGDPSPAPSPQPSDGIKVCSGQNFSGTCTVFTYTGDNGTVQSLGSLAHNIDSVQFEGSYTNAYDLVLCLQANCPASDRELQHDDPNFASSITQNQYVAIRIVKNAPPQTQPGAQICSGLNFTGGCIILSIGEFNRGDSGPWVNGENVSSVRYVNGWDAVHYHIRLWTQRDWNRTGNTNIGTPYNVDQNSISDLDNKDGNNPNPSDNFDNRIQSIQIYQQTAPNAPDSPTPADGSTITRSTVTLQWSSADQSQIHVWGTNYDLWHSWDAISSLTLQNLPSGTYSWQAQRENQLGASPWSPTWTFTVQVEQPQGEWNSPSDNFTVEKNGLLHFSANVVGSDVAKVNFRADWNGTWVDDICSFPTNDTHVYTCDWNIAASNVSDNTFIRTAFDAYASDGTKILSSPAGDRNGTYAPPQTPPIVTSSTYTVIEGQMQTNTITTTYAGSNKLSLTTSNLPSFASFKDNGNGTGTVTLKPITGNAGSYTFTVTASAGTSSGNGTFIIKVNPLLWKITDSLKTARFSAASLVLPNGKVLIVGGSSANYTALSSAEVYDPKIGTWTGTGSLKFARINPLAILLKSGKVLVSGGYTQYVVSTSELYDPSTGKWSQTGSLVNGSQTSTATLLQSGKVLLVQRGNAELYDPNTGKWTNTKSVVVSRLFNTAALLKSGKVLVAAGADSKGHDLSSSELYNPTTNSWTASGSLPKMVDYSNGMLLPNGKVLLVALTNTPYSLIVSMVYDPTTGKWSSTSALNHTGRYGSTLVVLPSGKALLAGGESFSSDENNTTTVEVYDSSTNKWTYTNSLTVGRAYHQTILLKDGRVLITGGIDASNKTVSSSELYG